MSSTTGVVQDCMTCHDCDNWLWLCYDVSSDGQSLQSCSRIWFGRSQRWVQQLGGC